MERKSCINSINDCNGAKTPAQSAKNCNYNLQKGSVNLYLRAKVSFHRSKNPSNHDLGHHNADQTEDLRNDPVTNHKAAKDQ